MLFTVSSKATSHLLAQPETGMGFQIVELQANTAGNTRLVLIENAIVVRRTWETVQESPYYIRLDRKSWIPESTERRIQEAVDSIDFVTLSHADADPLGIVHFKARDTRGQAIDAPIGQSDIGENFIRYSPYEKDFRILPGGGLRPGTFATTLLDGMTYVKTGMDAVRRYALPGESPATHRFFLRPREVVALRRGTVAAANGQPGGGEEVYFENGADSGTMYHHDTIPPGA